MSKNIIIYSIYFFFAMYKLFIGINYFIILFIPPLVVGALLRAALVANCLLGAFPPVG